MLGLDNFRDTFEAEEVSACRDGRSVQDLQADGALFLGFNADLEDVLQPLFSLIVESHRSLLFELLHDFHDALTAQLPMVATLTHAQENLKQRLEGPGLLVAACTLIVVLRKLSLRLFLEGFVAGFLFVGEGNSVLVLLDGGEPQVDEGHLLLPT